MPDTAATQHRIVHTIGHSTRTLDEVVGMLREHGVTDLVDVRAFPASRKHPQWNREEIARTLPDDIRYHWIQQLGGRRHTPAGTPTPNDGWRVKGFRDYADHMATPDFVEGLAALLALADHGRPAIMCSEAVPWRCHRRLITDALLVRDVDVRHIISPTRTSPAALTGFARVDGDRIIYPAEE